MAIQVHAKWVQITFLSLWGPIMLEQFQNSSGSHISISFSYIHQIYKNNRYKDFFFSSFFLQYLNRETRWKCFDLKELPFFLQLENFVDKTTGHMSVGKQKLQTEKIFGREFQVVLFTRFC